MKKLSLYDESYVRPLLARIAIIMISFIIRLYNNHFDTNIMFDELVKSVNILFTNGSESDNITIIERLVSIPFLGMLIISLRRKLERRVRR